MDLKIAVSIMQAAARGNIIDRAVQGQEAAAKVILKELNRLKKQNKEQWTPIAKGKPKSEQRVFVHYKNECDKDRTEIAQYIAPFTVKANEFFSDDDYDDSCREYNDADDEFYVVEGWWESSWEADTNWKISREIDAWMPLPVFWKG